MSHLKSFRLTLFALTALLTCGIPAQASILIRDADGGTNLSTEMSEVEGLVASANFMEPFGSTFQARTWAERMEKRGFENTWRASMDSLVFSGWYHQDLQVTIICVEQLTPEGLQHYAYREMGKTTLRSHLLW